MLRKARSFLNTIEKYSEHLITIDHYHARIHEGASYSFSKKFTVSSGSNFYFLGTTNGRQIHFFNFILAVNNGGIDIELYENPTVDNTGDLETQVSRNRENKTSPNFVLHSNPTISDDGTRLSIFSLFSSGNKQPVAGGDSNEWVLNGEEDYIYKVINTTNSDIDMNISFQWYEV